MPLTARQQRFVDEYLIDLNATQAAIRAGYSPKTAEAQASRLLRNVKVSGAVQKAQHKMAVRMEVTQEMVVKELARIGFFDHRSVYDEDGRLKLPNELDDTAAAVISSVESFEEYEGRGDRRQLTGHVRKVRFWDKVAALDKLARHLGMYTDKLEISGPGGGPTVVEVVIEHHKPAPQVEPTAGGDDGGSADHPVPPGPDAGVAE